MLRSAQGCAVPRLGCGDQPGPSSTASPPWGQQPTPVSEASAGDLRCRVVDSACPLLPSTISYKHLPGTAARLGMPWAGCRARHGDSLGWRGPRILVIGVKLCFGSFASQTGPDGLLRLCLLLAPSTQGCMETSERRYRHWSRRGLLGPAG